MSINLTHTNDSILPDSGNLSVTGNLVVSSRLGVGTSAPTSNLHVIGTANVTGNVTLSNTLIAEATTQNVGIGTTSPTERLHVSGSSGTVQLRVGDTNPTRAGILLQRRNGGIDAQSHWYLSSENSPWYLFGQNLTWSAERAGTVISTHAYKPYYEAYSPVNGYKEFGFVNKTSGSFVTSDLNAVLTLTSTGFAGINTTAPTSNLHVIGTANVTGNVTLSNTLTVVSTTGNVGVGTTSPSYKLQVNGSFAATTKSFVIDHPTKENHTLVYGSLEGPENGVYVRGRLQNKDTIELPDYWSALVDENSITVQLTPIGKHQNLYVKEIGNNTITVGTTGLFKKSIDCFYIVNGERKDVPKLQVEVSK